MLLAGAEANAGIAVLVAHGYFNAMIGRVLRKRGFVRLGSHRASFWNAVTYERPAPALFANELAREAA